MKIVSEKNEINPRIFPGVYKLDFRHCICYCVPVSKVVELLTIEQRFCCEWLEVKMMMVSEKNGESYSLCATDLKGLT